MSKVTETRWFKSGKVDFSQVSRIDTENGIILGVIMCQVGEALGHGVWLEQEFMDAGIAYAQKHHAQKGMKARFGHPSMSNETLGTEMGRFKNFRVEADKMVADLHLFESADLSPTQPGMRKWMLSMAQEDPSAIMCSIVFKIASFYQRDPEGNKYDIEYKREEWSGFWVSKDSKYKFDPDAKIYVSLKELMFCDIVDQGAATDKLFSINDDKFSVIASHFLDDHPDIDAFIQQHPEKIMEFIGKRFQIDQPADPGIIDKFFSIFKKSNQKSFYMSKIQLPKLAALAEKCGNNEASKEDFAAFQAELSEQGVACVVLGTAEHANLTQQIKNLSESQNTLTQQLSEKDAEVARLAAELADANKKLSESGKPAPIVTEGQQEFESSDDEIVLSPAEKQAKALRSIIAGAAEISN